MNQLNQSGINLIKSFESLRLEAYPDPGTGGKPWTIGYGHTGPEVLQTSTITSQDAEALLREDCAHTCNQVRSVVGSVINDNQFSALVSFTFNIGAGNLKSSSLLRFVNQGQFTRASDEFCKWIHANGKVFSGLVSRRLQEQQLFLTPV